MMESSDENIVRYKIFPVESSSASLENILDEILLIASRFTTKYIWQKDPFNLGINVEGARDGSVPPHLFGFTRFGDNVEDEWFIVYLLTEITKQMPGCVVSVNDDDGEFLLIEAAPHLPKWLTPETCENRIFLFNGNLHIVRSPNTPAELAILPMGTPSVVQSLSAIRTTPHLTRASGLIREAIEKRIEKFPERIEENFYTAHCKVPIRLAAVLHAEPELVAPAVEAFYERDPIDIRACRLMKHFPPDDLIITRVKMTRIMYAQLFHQQFKPDKRSQWKVPPTSHPHFKMFELGMKLAHGFEILASRADSRTGEGIGAEEVFGDRWNRFLEALKQKGFFKEEIEGSQKYKELLKDAKKFYKESTCQDQGSSQSPGEKILRMLKEMTIDIGEIRQMEQTLPPPEDDSWLYVTPDELDSLLTRMSQTSAAGNQDCNSSSVQSHPVYETSRAKQSSNITSSHAQRDCSKSIDLDSISSSLKSFVDNVSSYEGAEFPRMVERKLPAHTDSVTFDPDRFTKALEKILDCRSTDGHGGEVSEGEMEGRSTDGHGGEVSEGEMDSSNLSDHFFEEDLENSDSADDGDDEAQRSGGGSDEKVKELMEEMDRQLARTEIGKSFERSEVTQSGKVEATGEAQKEKCVHFASEEKNQDAEMDSDESELRPVEVDFNLLKNVLESYSSQQGLSGPASNILHSMGVHLPENLDQ